LCRNVTVRNVKIDSQGPNNDGCDPESSDAALPRELQESCLFLSSSASLRLGGEGVFSTFRESARF
jgi:hypothetical protein